jgi:hypothetical protein
MCDLHYVWRAVRHMAAFFFQTMFLAYNCSSNQILFSHVHHKTRDNIHLEIPRSVMCQHLTWQEEIIQLKFQQYFPVQYLFEFIYI